MKGGYHSSPIVLEFRHDFILEVLAVYALAPLSGTYNSLKGQYQLDPHLG
jgi:hypothetical protein